MTPCSIIYNLEALLHVANNKIIFNDIDGDYYKQGRV